MQFSELTAVGTVSGKPILDHDDGKPVCRFTLKVDSPGKQGFRVHEIACKIIGGNAAACWSSILEKDELTVVGIPFCEGYLDENGNPKGRQCLRINFVRYSQPVLERIEQNRLS